MARGEAAEQARPGRPCPRRHRHHHRSRLTVRRDGQAAARVQAPAPQAAACRHRVQPDQGGSGRRHHALHGHLRREGGAELPAGETHHQVDQLGRIRGQRRPRRRRPDQGRLPARLQRLGQRARGARRQYLRADLPRRQGGIRHRQHETGPQRGRHRRHARRRQHRDPRPGRSRQLLPLRPHRRRGHRPPATRATPPTPITATTPNSRQPSTLSPQVPSPAATATPSSRSSPRSCNGTSTWSSPTTGPTSTATTRPRAGLGRSGPVDPNVDPEHGTLGFLLLRPHSPRLLPRHLARRARAHNPGRGGRPEEGLAQIVVRWHAVRNTAIKKHKPGIEAGSQLLGAPLCFG